MPKDTRATCTAGYTWCEPELCVGAYHGKYAKVDAYDTQVDVILFIDGEADYTGPSMYFELDAWTIQFESLPADLLTMAHLAQGCKHALTNFAAEVMA